MDLIPYQNQPLLRMLNYGKHYWLKPPVVLFIYTRKLNQSNDANFMTHSHFLKHPC